ncbi:MAG: Rib/alpha-like domain-containing protein, partial [Aerococcus sp.]|nr:Rib/alpha-like domain-containing protein [Aerococcus sp.]
PDGTDIHWKDPIDTTKPGDHKGTIEVVYPDGSKDEVDITIHVVKPETDADKYNPEGQDVTVKPGEKPDANDGIANKDELPDGTDIHWKDPIDTTKPGDHKGTIEIVYPDGSKDYVEVVVHVVKPEEKPDNQGMGQGDKSDKDLTGYDGTPMTDKNTDQSGMGRLPQTGATTSQAGLLGAVVATLGGLFTFGKKRRKEDE